MVSYLHEFPYILMNGGQTDARFSIILCPAGYLVVRWRMSPVALVTSRPFRDYHSSDIASRPPPLFCRRTWVRLRLTCTYLSGRSSVLRTRTLTLTPYNATDTDRALSQSLRRATGGYLSWFYCHFYVATLLNSRLTIQLFIFRCPITETYSIPI